MRKLAYLMIIGGIIYVLAYQVPPEAKRNALAAVGLTDFFGHALPNYLRQKLSIPENPVTKRARLLGELTQAIGGIERELEAVAPPETNGTAPAPAAPLASKDIRTRIEKTREFLARSEEVLKELENANPKSGLVQKAGERLLERILPAQERGTTASAADGLGGDASSLLCPPR